MIEVIIHSVMVPGDGSCRGVRLNWGSPGAFRPKLRRSPCVTRSLVNPPPPTPPSPTPQMRFRSTSALRWLRQNSAPSSLRQKTLIRCGLWRAASPALLTPPPPSRPLRTVGGWPSIRPSVAIPAVCPVSAVTRRGSSSKTEECWVGRLPLFAFPPQQCL